MQGLLRPCRREQPADNISTSHFPNAMFQWPRSERHRKRVTAPLARKLIGPGGAPGRDGVHWEAYSPRSLSSTSRRRSLIRTLQSVAWRGVKTTVSVTYGSCRVSRGAYRFASFSRLFLLSKSIIRAPGGAHARRPPRGRGRGEGTPWGRQSPRGRGRGRAAAWCLVPCLRCWHVVWGFSVYGNLAQPTRPQPSPALQPSPSTAESLSFARTPAHPERTAEQSGRHYSQIATGDADRILQYSQNYALACNIPQRTLVPRCPPRFRRSVL